MVPNDEKRAIRTAVKRMIQLYNSDLITDNIFKFYISNAIAKEIDLSINKKFKNDKLFNMEDKLFIMNKL